MTENKKAVGMTPNQIIRKGLVRLGLIFALSAALVLAGSEIFFRLQNETAERAPRQVTLVIPEGTAEQVAQGESVPSIPDEMVFVVGDILVVRNEDVVDHELGPLWIPAQSSVSMPMDEPQDYTAECSFKPENYLGLTVRKATTWETRMQAVVAAAPATTIFLFLYSLLVFPLVPEEKKSPRQAQAPFVEGVSDGDEK